MTTTPHDRLLAHLAREPGPDPRRYIVRGRQLVRAVERDADDLARRAPHYARQAAPGARCADADDLLGRASRLRADARMLARRLDLLIAGAEP